MKRKEGKPILNLLFHHIKLVFPNIRIGIIFVLALGLRFYNLQNRISLGNETVRDAFVGLVGARELQFPITGPFSSFGAFTFGPWYWYHLIVGSIVIPSIISPWMMTAILSSLTVLVFYHIGRLLKGESLGLIMAFLATISPQLLLSSIHLTNPNMTIVYASLTLFLFLRNLTGPPSKAFLFFYGLSTAIAADMHFQGFNLFLLLPLLFIIRRDLIKKSLYVFIGVVLAFLPLGFFNVLNHWHQVRNILYTFLHGKEIIYVPNSWKLYLFVFLPSLWNNTFSFSKTVGIITFVMSALATLYYVTIRKNRTLLILISSFLIIFISLRYYWGERNFSYYNFLIPYFYVFLSLPLVFLIEQKQMLAKIAFLLLLLLYVFFSIPQIAQRLRTDEYYLHIQRITKALEKAFGTTDLLFYNCLYHQSSRDYSVAYVLYSQGKNVSSGKPVGFFDASCLSDIPDADREKRKIEVLDGLSAVDLSEASASALDKNGWVALTPRFFYDHHAKWWYDEKP